MITMQKTKTTFTTILKTFIFPPQRDSQIHSLSFFKYNFFLLKGVQYYNDP